MGFDDLRTARAAARHALELATIRSRGAATPANLEPLREEVRILTDALIDCYAADLALVDQLLVPHRRTTHAQRRRVRRLIARQASA